MSNLNNLSVKKRKNDKNKVKNDIKTTKIDKNIQKTQYQSVAIFAWVKTLISVHDVLPNIIKLIDKMVEANAASATNGSAIFGDHRYGTFGQVQQILDMEERKLSLINLYKLIEEMTRSLPQKYAEFLNLKFYKHKKMQYIAEELEIDERTAFRWSHSVINLLVEFCEKNNWTEMFFMSQTHHEPWLREQYQKNYKKMLESDKVCC